MTDLGGVGSGGVVGSGVVGSGAVGGGAVDADVVDYDPFSMAAMSDPLPIYRRLRDHHPVYRLDRYSGWALSRFADVWEVEHDTEHFSIADGPIFAQERISTPPAGPPPAPPTDPMPSFSTLDPPLNPRLRQALGGPLRPAPVGRLESVIRSLACSRLDELVPAGRFDITADYAGPVSAGVMCRLVGFPPSAATAVLGLVNRSMGRKPPGLTADGQRAGAELHGMLTELVAARRRGGDADPGSMIGGLLDTQVEGRTLTDREIAVQLSTIVSGGTETVPKIVAGGLLELWRHPDQRAAVAGDAGRSAAAFEEMLRYGAPLQWVGRTVTEPVVVAGTAMAPGERVLLLLASANRDEREFDDPDEFHWDRQIRRHLAFGYGVHFCIGHHVARLEGRVLLDELLNRIPDYEIDVEGAVRPPSEFQVGYTAMPLVVA
ncbi:MAG TPA: cytochrome P450 [Acidimicrobiales bacterium]